MPRPTPKSAFRTLAWAAFFLLVLNGAAQVHLPLWLDPHRAPQYVVRRDRVLERLREAERSAPGAKPLLLASLGSSRMLNALEGKVAEERAAALFGGAWRAMNFASTGANQGVNLTTLGRLFRDGIVPDLLLLEASPVLMAEGAWPILCVPAFLEPAEADHAWLRRHGLPTMAHLDPKAAGPALFTYRSDLFRVLLKTPYPTGPGHWHHLTDPFGSLPIPAHPLTLEERRGHCSRLAPFYNEAKAKFQFGAVDLAALRATLETCRSRGVAVVLVVMPEGPIFREGYRPGAREEVGRALGSLAAQTGAVFLDGTEWLEEEAFIDSFHLMGDGPARFTGRALAEAAAQWSASGPARDASPPPPTWAARPSAPVR